MSAVTIGLPVYNEERFIRGALDSLLTQEFQDFVLLVCDNASTDATVAICREYEKRDARVRVQVGEQNVGAVGNFRRAVELAETPYFMWAAADDRWSPRFVGRLVRELDENPQALLAMSAVQRIDEGGRELDVVRFQGRDDPNARGPWGMLKGFTSNRKYNLFLYGLFRTDALRRTMPLFPPALGGDRLFLMQFAAAAPIRYVDEVLHFKTRQERNELAYAAANRRRGAHRAQLAGLARILARSPIIPWTRKVVLVPAALVRYGSWTLGKAYGSKETWRLLSWYLDSDGILVNLSRRTRLAALLGGASVAALLGYAWMAVGLPFALGVAIAAAAVLIAGATLSMVRSTQRMNAAAFATLERRLADVEEKIHTTVGLAAKRTVAQLFPLFNEIRYLTDLQIDSVREPNVEKGNALSRYAFERHQKHRRTVEFARNLEASRIRELYLGELFAGIEKVSIPIGAVNELTGHPNKVDLLYVCAIARHRGAKDIFEFGTYLGRTTYHLTFASEGAHVTTLNLPPEADPRYAPYLGMYFRGTDREPFITQLYEDSRAFDVGPHRGRYDLVFVDGDHSYEAVENDTRKAFEMLKPGGAILWHDYAPKSEGLVRFFRDFTQTRVLFRIKRTCVLLHLDGVDPMTFTPHPLPPSLEQDTDVDPLYVEELYHA